MCLGVEMMLSHAMRYALAWAPEAPGPQVLDHEIGRVHSFCLLPREFGSLDGLNKAPKLESKDPFLVPRS